MKASSMAMTLLLAIAVASAPLAVVACDDSSAVKEATTRPDGGRPTANVDGGTGGEAGPGTDGGPGDCVQDPKTHEEIINGCTDAVKITKNPTLPLLLVDGGLPPLP